MDRLGAVLPVHANLPGLKNPLSRLILCIYWLFSLLLAVLMLLLPSSGLLVTGTLYCLLICLLNCSLSMILLYFSHVILNSFTLQILQEQGGGSAEGGTATAIAAIFETVTVI